MSSYQGYLYLTLGFSSYVILLLSLRLISTQNDEGKDISEDSCGWHSKEELLIVDIIEETHDIKTFRFKRKNEKGFMSFLPGQFLSFQIKDDVKLLRSYSISGSCENRSTLQVSIKKLKDGLGSEWFHSLNIGDSVWAFPPGGLFSDTNLDLNKRRILVGGGIGITPLISMVKTNIDRSNKTPMSLFYGMNTIDDMAFHDELSLLDKAYENFSYYPVLSNKDKSWEGETGYITYDFIISKQKVEESDNFYFCGPPIMTDSITESLVQSGHSINAIHGEKFASPVAFDLDNIPERNVDVEINDEVISYSGKDSILEFLENNNIEVGFACRSGVCGACKCKLIEGKVDSYTDSGLTAQEKIDGYVLTCVSRPKNNIKIKL